MYKLIWNIKYLTCDQFSINQKKGEPPSLFFASFTYTDLNLGPKW